MRRFSLFIIAVVSALAAMAAVTDAQLVEIQKQRGYTELWGQRATLFNTLGCDSTDIVMFGNSLTHGDEWHELFNDHRILNRGINGDVVQGLIDRLDCIVDGHPAKIFLLIGANDVSHNLTADSIATAIGGLIEQIRRRSPGSRLYVQSLLPINNKDFNRYKAMAGKEQVIRDVNILLEPIARANGATWINVHDALVDQDGNLRADLTNDGLHLLGQGYLIWREKLLPYINE
ncbi:MAG: GDSL-type esterase/lipase family protein [Bacteroidales bacterium]|nr:GDSL-type esterase/lipase family protein [Bacteroidales bacterium]